ncbi:hypothetical protein Droror1_Dr00015722 [Drosera rotundifolia]
MAASQEFTTTSPSVTTKPSITTNPLQPSDCPSLPQSPILMSESGPKSPLMRVMTPIASPMRKTLATMHGYLEEVGHITKLDPHDAWLPITESRNGNAYYAAFHSLSSGIGFQALVLPLAFVSLGWVWGVACLSFIFAWQLYTLWLLIQLHESEDGTRYSRYLRLSMAAFGKRTGKLLALFPIMYLSGGTCVTLIMVGGGTMKIFFEITHPGGANHPLTTIEWYLVFTGAAIILAQLPNLNSIAGVSLIGAITAISYCTIIWITSVSKGKPMDINYGPSSIMLKSQEAKIRSILDAIGIIVFAFRGHNLALEIQGTMSTSKKQQSCIPMWQGVQFAYTIIGLCLFPLAIGGYWAYGNLIPANGGMLRALQEYHGHDLPKFLLGITSLLVVINSLSSFQIYAMPVFDNLEFRYISTMNKPCPRWVRTAIRVLFGCLAFFISVALPFLPSLAGLMGGIAILVTLAYPCLMWAVIKKPHRFSMMWHLNWGLGCFGIFLSALLVTGAIWSIVIMGIEVHFFKPQ